MEFELHGLRLAAKAWGPQDAPPIVALHGWLDNANSFDLLAPRLPGHRVIAVDVPGHGLSDWRPASASYNFVDWLALPYDIADHFGWDRFTLMGHSMGAGISSLAAGVFPERIEKVVLIEGLGPLTGEDDEAPNRVAEHITQRRNYRPKRKLLPHESRDVAAARLSKAVPGLTEASARIIVERGTKEVEGGVTWRADPRLRQSSSIRFNEAQVRAFLQRIEADMLLVWGEEGWAFPPDMMESRCACVKKLRREKLPGGHHLHMDNVDQVAPLVAEFLG